MPAVAAERLVHLDTNPYRLVAETFRDHGMGPPYDTVLIRHRLWVANFREHGKRYFLTLGEGPYRGWTWVSDEKAEEIRQRWWEKDRS